VTQVEDIGTLPPLFQKLVHPRQQGVAAGAQQQGIERALDSLGLLDRPAQRGRGLGVQRHALDGRDLGV